MRPADPAQSYLKGLIESYDQFAVDCKDDFMSRDLAPIIEGHPLMDHFIKSGGDLGYWWCRHQFAANLEDSVFCMANIRLPPSIRGQGVFSQYLDHVMSNPHHFKWIRVEALDREGDLESYLRRRGFEEFRPWNSKFDYSTIVVLRSTYQIEVQ